MGAVSTKDLLENIGFRSVELNDKTKISEDMVVTPFTTSSKIEMATNEENRRGVLIDDTVWILDEISLLFSECVNRNIMTVVLPLSAVDDDIITTNVREITNINAACFIMFKHGNDVYMVEDRAFNLDFCLCPKYKTILNAVAIKQTRKHVEINEADESSEYEETEDN